MYLLPYKIYEPEVLIRLIDLSELYGAQPILAATIFDTLRNSPLFDDDEMFDISNSRSKWSFLQFLYKLLEHSARELAQWTMPNVSDRQ